jgi:predicted alpha/beta-hydrolase family hydrolase
MTDEAFEVAVEGAGTVSALRTAPEQTRSDLVFIYAPGAGSNLNDPFGAFCARRLATENIATWRFQFPYMQAKRGGPDRPPVLEATWWAVLRQALTGGGRVVISGRSMGGRIASYVAAQQAPIAGLALFAYPLHPPGRPQLTRDAHLASINVPALFCSGTRDTYASPDELRSAASLLKQSSVHLLEGADHGFAVLKSSGRSRDDVYEEAVAALLSFIASLEP